MRSWIDHAAEVVWDPSLGTIEKGWPAFLVLGVALSAVCAGVTVFVLSRRGWN